MKYIYNYDIIFQQDHRLDFIYYSKRWKGAASTIVPDPAFKVWGVVWEIDVSDMPNLDEQEGVANNIYFAKNIIVKTTTGNKIECRVYQQCRLPDEYVEPSQLPPKRQPSLIYL